MAKKKAVKKSKKAVSKAKKAPPKKTAKKAAKKSKAKKVVKVLGPKEVEGGIFLGDVEDYFAHVNVIALTLKKPLAVGDTIRVKGQRDGYHAKGGFAANRSQTRPSRRGQRRGRHQDYRSRTQRRPVYKV